MQRCVGTRPVQCLSHFCSFFNDTATTEIYTLSLHDALPILCFARQPSGCRNVLKYYHTWGLIDRKSTRLNSSHLVISYAVFCLKNSYTKVCSSHTGECNARFYAGLVCRCPAYV